MYLSEIPQFMFTAVNDLHDNLSDIKHTVKRNDYYYYKQGKNSFALDQLALFTDEPYKNQQFCMIITRGKHTLVVRNESMYYYNYSTTVNGGYKRVDIRCEDPIFNGYTTEEQFFQYSLIYDLKNVELELLTKLFDIRCKARDLMLEAFNRW